MTLGLRNVSKTLRGEDHIHDVSLTLEHGTLNVLLGPTLSGTTTLMRLMAGLDRPTSGPVVWDGDDVTGVPVRKRRVALVYQQFLKYPTLRASETTPRPLSVARPPKAQTHRRGGAGD